MNMRRLKTSNHASNIGHDVKSQPSNDLEAWVGQVIAQYRIVAVRGCGAMGIVFDAEDVSLRRPVALKVLPRQFARNERASEIDLFLREARSAAVLDHPNIVRVLEVDQDDGWYFAALELIDGQDLEKLVEKQGPLPVGRVCKFAYQAAQALDAAHGYGIVHRDIKPANLMVDHEDRCKVADFGLVHFEETNASGSNRLKTFGIVGTPLFASPEALSGQTVDARSDIYSLAATIWFALAGKPPFGAADEATLIDQVCNCPVPTLEPIRPDIPQGIADLIQQGLAKDRDDRPRSAEAFSQALITSAREAGLLGDEALAGELPQWREPKPTLAAAGDADSSTNDRPRAWSVATIVVLLLLVGTLIVVGRPAWTTGGSAPEFEPIVGAPAPSPVDGEAIDWSGLDPAKVLTVEDRDLMEQIVALGDRRAFAVRGRIASVERSESGRRVTIQFEGADPEAGFYAAFFSRLENAMARSFGDAMLSDLIGRQVQIKGTLQMFRGRPQIIIRTPRQLQRIDSDLPATINADAQSRAASDGVNP